MKKIINKHCIYLLLAVFISVNVYSQNECGTQDFPTGQAPYANDFFGGYLKPQRTDSSSRRVIPRSKFKDQSMPNAENSADSMTLFTYFHRF